VRQARRAGDPEATRDAHLGLSRTAQGQGGARGGSCPRTEDAPRSVFIINVPNRKAAEVFSSEEPFRKAGLFQTTRCPPTNRPRYGRNREGYSRRSSCAPRVPTGRAAMRVIFVVWNSPALRNGSSDEKYLGRLAVRAR